MSKRVLLENILVHEQKNPLEEKETLLSPTSELLPRRSLHHRLVWGHVVILAIALFFMEGSIYLAISPYLITRTHFLFRLIVFLMCGSFCVLFIVYCFGTVLTGRELRPLVRLSQKMAEVALLERHFPFLAPQKTSEMQMLATAFNQMIARLEESFLLQEHFVTDVSHELRTPLTSIRGYIDLLLLNPQQDEETQQDLYRMRAEVDRLSRLVANILTHARVEIGVFPQCSPCPSLVDLDGLLLETMEEVRFVKPGVKVAFGQFQPSEVPGERDLLKQLFLNLLDNAVTYTPEGGRVTIDITPSAEILPLPGEQVKRVWVKVACRDTGPGIAESDLPYLFERYYRASRQAGRRKQSSGLGLSIALMLAQAHGGTITVMNEPEGGACFTVWLPAAQE